MDEEIANLLKAWPAGDPAALDRLSKQVYDELRRMARRHSKANGGTTRGKPPPWSTKCICGWSM